MRISLLSGFEHRELLARNKPVQQKTVCSECRARKEEQRDFTNACMCPPGGYDSGAVGDDDGDDDMCLCL